MQTNLTGIDHPVIGIRDMQSAYNTYQKLGFTIPPRGYHPKWGTGNWCIMFEHDYLELRGVVDPEKGVQKMKPFFDHYDEGLMGVALSTNNAQTCYEDLVEQGLQPQEVKELTRNFELPDGLVKPRFALCFLDQQDTPGLMSVVICQHLTPDLLRRPEWLHHKNGTIGVVSMTGFVTDLDAAQQAHIKIFGSESVLRKSNYLEIQVGKQHTIQLTTPDFLAELHPEIESLPQGPLPRLIAVTLQTNNLQASKEYFSSQNIQYIQNTGSITVLPQNSCGVVFKLQE